VNVIFLSPAFPPTASAFCAALAREGATVLGIGDEPWRKSAIEAAGLTDYVYEPHMAEHQPLHDVVDSLRARFGPIDRIESDGERWLAEEARLRDDFDVEGMRTEALRSRRSKLGMAELFGRAQIPYPPTAVGSDATGVRRLAKKYGYPLVFKPEVGSGAVDTFMVNREGDLAAALEPEPQSLVVQPFISDRIVTFDGLADREGRPVFWTSHAYDTGIMQVRAGKLDGSYYSLRELPPGLEELGRRAVAAFDVRERFFHVEFFQLPDESFVALEMNLRPPGGFTTDMMNAACDIDVYALWAALLVGRDLSGFRFERKYHVAHAGRRAGRHYALSTAMLRERLGSTLLAERPVPAQLACTLGDAMFMLRDPELSVVKRAISLVQTPAAPTASASTATTPVTAVDSGASQVRRPGSARFSRWRHQTMRASAAIGTA